jgi:hypothetical protein
LAGRGAWFALSGYTVEKLLGIGQRTAARWLAMLVEDGFLVVTKAGGDFRAGRRMAREYRVVRDSPDHTATQSDTQFDTQSDLEF